MEKDTEYDIINNVDLFDFIYKFDSKDENMDKYNASVSKNNVGNNDIFESYVSYFDMDGYIENIKKSYKNNEDRMYNQFKIDYDRQNIKLNGYKYNQNKFINNLDYLLSDVSPNKIYDLSWRTLIILLCCQSSFSLPYLILQKKYISSGNNENKILTSGGIGSLDINININNNKVTIELNNICYLKKLENAIKTDKIISSVTIELDKKIKNYKYESLICVFTWKNIKIA